MDKALFEKMPNNPLADMRTPILAQYPVLRRCEAFTERPDLASKQRTEQVHHLSEGELDTCVRFVILYVEPENNPIAKEKDLSYRSKMAWDMLGVKASSPLRARQVEGHWWFNLLIFEYFKYTYDMDYQEWFSLKSQFHSLTKLITSNLDEALDEKAMGVRQKAASQINSLKTQIAALEAIIFKNGFLKSEIAVETFFPNRMAEAFALDYNTKERRSFQLS